MIFKIHQSTKIEFVLFLLSFSEKKSIYFNIFDDNFLFLTLLNQKIHLYETAI